MLHVPQTAEYQGDLLKEAGSGEEAVIFLEGEAVVEALGASLGEFIDAGSEVDGRDVVPGGVEVEIVAAALAEVKGFLRDGPELHRALWSPCHDFAGRCPGRAGPSAPTPGCASWRRATRIR